MREVQKVVSSGKFVSEFLSRPILLNGSRWLTIQLFQRDIKLCSHIRTSAHSVHLQDTNGINIFQRQSVMFVCTLDKNFCTVIQKGTNAAKSTLLLKKLWDILYGVTNIYFSTHSYDITAKLSNSDPFISPIFFCICHQRSVDLRL